MNKEVIEEKLNKYNQDLISSLNLNLKELSWYILSLIEERDRLKTQIEQFEALTQTKYENKNVKWFGKEFAKMYGELCDTAGANNDREPVVYLKTIKLILKGDNNE